MMKAWNKALLSFSLVCYLAATSIAAVHAYPIPSNDLPSNLQMGMMGLSGTADQTTMPCHQMPDDMNFSELESNNNSVTACEIFCAAIGHAISHYSTDVALANNVTAEVTFTQPKFYKGDHSLEPYPPK